MTFTNHSWALGVSLILARAFGHEWGRSVGIERFISALPIESDAASFAANSAAVAAYTAASRPENYEAWRCGIAAPTPNGATYRHVTGSGRTTWTVTNEQVEVTIARPTGRVLTCTIDRQWSDIKIEVSGAFAARHVDALLDVISALVEEDAIYISAMRMSGIVTLAAQAEGAETWGAEWPPVNEVPGHHAPLQTDLTPARRAQFWSHVSYVMGDAASVAAH
jgi:hypothetical protein